MQNFYNYKFNLFNSFFILIKMSKTQWNLKISNYRNNIMIYNKNTSFEKRH